MAKADDIVFFENSAGEKVSNDPRWHAQKTLASYGVEGKQDFDMPGEYDDLSGAELKALAKERGISAKGFRKASQYREALEAWDEEQEDSDESDEDESNDDPSSDSSDEQE